MLIGWLFLTVPFFAGSGFLGLGESVSLKSGDKVTLWVPPLVKDGMLLRIDARNADSLVYQGEMRRTLWVRGDAARAAVPCGDLSRNGVLEVHSATRDAQADLRLVGQLSLAKGILFVFVFFGVKRFVVKRISNSNVLALFNFALGVRFFYGFAVPWNISSPDVRDHFTYIRLLFESLSLPEPGACLQCYQPPPYYVLATGWTKLGMALGIYPTDFLRILSLLMSAGFLYFGLKIIDYILGCTREGFVAMLLFAFWPASILIAPVINNDVPVNLFGAISLLFLLHWRDGGKDRSLLVALVCAGLATLFKSSGVLYMVLIGLGMAGWGRRILCRREVIQAIVAFILVGAVAMGTNLLRSQRAEGSDPLVGNFVNHSTTYANLRDVSDLETFLPLPAQVATAFEKTPNDNVTPEAFTHSFWAASLRSNVDGMHRMDDQVQNGLLLLQIKMALLVFLVFLAIQGAYLGGRENLFLAAGVVLFIGASMAFRWRYPFACSANVRYVLGLIIPFSVLVGVASSQWKGYWKLAPWFLVACFSVLSIWMYFAFAVHYL